LTHSVVRNKNVLWRRLVWPTLSIGVYPSPHGRAIRTITRL